MPKTKTIPDYQSALRSIISDSDEIVYNPLKNLEVAKKHEDAHVIMEGDWGGQIYVVVPAKLVKCSHEILKKLLVEIDKLAWNEAEGTGLYFERMKDGVGVVGGMGGGLATGSLWVHSELASVKDKIQDVLDGKAQSISK